MKKPKKVLYAFRTSKEVFELLTKIAEENQVTVTAVIETCLTEPLSVYDLSKNFPKKPVVF